MRRNGFSLLMVSALMAITAIAIISIFSVLPAKHDIAQKQTTLKQMKAIDMALQEFLSKNGRLPCPASPLDLPTNDQYGVEQRVNFICDANRMTSYGTPANSFLGIIPFKTLGLEAQKLADGWDNKIEYAISDKMFTNSYEDINNNFRSSAETISIQNTGDNVPAAYALISRGDQGGGIPLNTNQRSDFSNINASEKSQRFNCTNSDAVCQNPASSPLYARESDIILYHSKAEVIQLCASNSPNNNCVEEKCINFAHILKWQNNTLRNVSDTLTLHIDNISPLPSLPLESRLAPHNQFTLHFTIKNLDLSSGSITLLYDYLLPDDSTIHTTTLATFSASNGYTASDIGKTIDINFGDTTHIPKQLYFTKALPDTNTSVALNLSDVNITNRLFDQQNYLFQQIWRNIPNSSNSISDLITSKQYPNAPYEISLVQNFAGPKNYGTNYGVRIYGYIVPVVSGNYIFYIASSDPSTLFLSTDASEGNKVEIAYVPGSTAQDVWNKFPTQTSNIIKLEAGKSYFIEGIFKSNSSTPDHFEVAWTTPNGQNQSIISSGELSTSPTQ